MKILESIVLCALVLYIFYKLYKRSFTAFDRDPDNRLTPQELEKYGEDDSTWSNGKGAGL